MRQALFRLQQEGYVEVLFSGWRVLPFDFDQFEQLYDLRMVLETTAAQRLCADGDRVDRVLLDELAAFWLVPAAGRSTDMVEVSQRDEAFHCSLVAAAGNAEDGPRAPRRDRPHPHHPQAGLHQAGAH